MLIMTIFATVFYPASPQAASISHLFVITLIICAVIFAVVVGIISFGLMRFRSREGDPDPKQVAGNHNVEIIWTVIPFLIVAVLFAMTARTMNLSDPPPFGDPDLVVTGHQWWWDVRYPKSGVVTANEIHIPVGKPISVELRSGDVLHEFWVPELARKMTTVPGWANRLWIQADKPGRYPGVCTEFCGTQHAWMRFTVVAEDAETFAAWQQAQLQPAVAPTGESTVAVKGLALFKEKTCLNCHAIAGTGAVAGVGPDLTHFASRTQFGGGIIENNPSNLRRWLANPQALKPGVKMPNFKFTDEQLTDLTAYIGSLK